MKKLRASYKETRVSMSACTLRRASKKSKDFVDSKTSKQLQEIVSKVQDLKQALAAFDAKVRRQRQTLCQVIKGSWKSDEKIEISNSRGNDGLDDYEIEYSVPADPKRIPNHFKYDGKVIDVDVIGRKRAMDLDLLLYRSIRFSQLYSDQTELVKRAGFDSTKTNSDDADAMELFAYNQKADTFAIFFDNGDGRVHMITFRIKKSGRYTVIKKKLIMKDASIVRKKSSARVKAVVSKLPEGFTVLFS